MKRRRHDLSSVFITVDDPDTPWHPQFFEFPFLSQFSAALALGACVQLCRSIGTYCSRGPRRTLCRASELPGGRVYASRDS